MTQKPQKTTLLLDLDGTLIDSVPDLASSINYMLKELGYDEQDTDTIRSWVGNGALVLVQRALFNAKGLIESDNRLTDIALEIFLSHYKEHPCENTYLYPYVSKSLKSLHKQGYTLAIITNKPVEFVAPILERLGVSEYFTDFIGGNSLDTKKPDPEPLLYMCQKLDKQIDECIMIGDSRNDIIAANSCSMQSIALSYGYNYDEDISIHSPTYLVDSFADILPIVGASHE